MCAFFTVSFKFSFSDTTSQVILVFLTASLTYLYL